MPLWHSYTFEKTDEGKLFTLTAAKPFQGRDKLKEWLQMLWKAKESLVNKEVLNYGSHENKWHGPSLLWVGYALHKEYLDTRRKKKKKQPTTVMIIQTQYCLQKS